MNSRIAVFTVLLLAAGCGQSVDDPLEDVGALVANRGDGSLRLIRERDPMQVEHVAQVGDLPNHLLARGDEILVLAAQSDSLHVVGIGDWSVAREYSLGAGCGPRMMALTQDQRLLVSCWESNELILVDPEADGDPVLDRMSMPETGELLPWDPENPGQARPGGLAVDGHRAFVALENVWDTLEAAGPGLVLVADVSAWTMDKIIELSSSRPVWIHRPVSGGSRFYVSCLSAVEVLDAPSASIAETIDLGGTPGRMWVGGNGIAWVAGQADGRVLRFDARTLDVLEPVNVCAPGFMVFDVSTNGRGRVYASCPDSNTVETFLVEDGSSNAVGLEAGQQPGALLVIQR